MRRFELGMSINYCNTWGVVEAVREFFQNAIDAEKENPENKMFFDYDEEKECLYIGNKKGVLGKSTLLLGNSSKTSNTALIGKFGEGYKVATVVLLRLGKQVMVYNRNADEIWNARVINSRRYKSQIGVFDIEKTIDVADAIKRLFSSGPKESKKYNLVFAVNGITKDEYRDIVRSNLYLSENHYVVSTEGCGSNANVCRILTDESQKGRLYVGGLYVSTSKHAYYGYDFSPNMVTLDRDRGFIDNLDLQFLCGKALLFSKDSKLIDAAKDTWDGEYIRIFAEHRMDSNTISEAVIPACEAECQKFHEEYGDDAVAVTDTDEFNCLKKNGVNAVMVKENKAFYITHSPSYVRPSISAYDEKKDTAERLEGWFEQLSKKIEELDSSNEAMENLLAIIDDGNSIINKAASLLRK